MGRWRYRACLEEGLKLDLNRLFRDGLAKRGEIRRGTISWHRVSFGDVVAAGTIEADFREEPFGWITLKFGNLEHCLQCCGARRHFGGVQWYFICPGGGGRASVLWRPAGANQFLSRKAWGRRAAYGWQFESPHGRAISRAQNIRYRLGGKEYLSLAAPDPPKPKGMHWRTYEAQLRRCEADKGRWNLHLFSFVQRLKKS
jgi:hypothetical protein